MSSSTKQQSSKRTSEDKASAERERVAMIAKRATVLIRSNDAAQRAQISKRVVETVESMYARKTHAQVLKTLNLSASDALAYAKGEQRVSALKDEAKQALRAHVDTMRKRSQLSKPDARVLVCVLVAHAESSKKTTKCSSKKS